MAFIDKYSVQSSGLSDTVEDCPKFLTGRLFWCNQHDGHTIWLTLAVPHDTLDAHLLTSMHHVFLQCPQRHYDDAYATGLHLRRQYEQHALPGSCRHDGDNGALAFLNRLYGLTLHIPERHLLPHRPPQLGRGIHLTQPDPSFHSLLVHVIFEYALYASNSPSDPCPALIRTAKIVASPYLRRGIVFVYPPLLPPSPCCLGRILCRLYAANVWPSRLPHHSTRFPFAILYSHPPHPLEMLSLLAPIAD